MLDCIRVKVLRFRFRWAHSAAFSMYRKCSVQSGGSPNLAQKLHDEPKLAQMAATLLFLQALNPLVGELLHFKLFGII